MKPLVLILLAILVVGSLSLAGYYYRSKLNINQILSSAKKGKAPTETIISKGKVSDLIAKDPNALFYADLEYDPKTGVTTQLKTGAMNAGDERFPLSPNLPKDLSSANFVYQIKTLSPDGKSILESGWKITFKKIVETTKGTYRFGVTALYKPGSIIKVYLPGDKLIWTGKIQGKSL